MVFATNIMYIPLSLNRAFFNLEAQPSQSKFGTLTSTIYNITSTNIVRTNKNPFVKTNSNFEKPKKKKPLTDIVLQRCLKMKDNRESMCCVIKCIKCKRE